MRVYRDDQKFLTFRINALLWAIVIIFVFLAGSFWVVQGVQAEKYRNLSASNALRELVTPAKRGLILDRSGQKILADNQPAYSLSLDRMIMRPILKADPTHRQKVVAFLAQVLGVLPQEIEARFEKGKNIAKTHPIPIAEDLSMPQVASIQAEALAFPELNVEPVQRRNYPYGTMAAHIMGFIGEANDKDLAVRKDLKPGDLLGKRGVELIYDEYLRGHDGVQYWEYDSHGRRLAEYRPARKEPLAGDNVYLTIDFDLQRRAEQYFIENEFVGSAVALDPRNGEVLAMVSSPAFNPNVYSRRFSPDVWRTIASNPFKVELNRAIQGLYSPGSVFKAVMAMAGLSEGSIDTTTSFFCSGSGVFFGRRFRCYNKNGHGDVSVANALKVSCDMFFFNVGARLGVDRIAEYAHKLTFGEVSRIDLDGEKPGLVPSSQWAAVKQHRKWYPSETISVAIGQGPLLVTPLQVANLMAAISNGGTVYRPHVVRMIEKVKPDGSVERLQVASEVLHQVTLAPKALETVKLGLWKVVNEEGGTGGNARIEGLDVSGKTGTVQVIAQHGWVKTEGLPYKYKDHAWFASYAPKDNPRMVVVVFVEHGGHGGVDAAPLAKLLYESHFHSQVTNASLDLSNPDTLEAIKEGQAPVPGQVKKAPAAPSGSNPNLGH
ncbi:MAG TPA: penicillin-binding protein 2 [Thermoanaerobaculia bacterium]|jgi:penicillin-binding protein 2|nr:penicillin-binding protein 2 [Thermoanaerobaculia bacterium]